MKIIQDISCFIELTGLIWNWHELRQLGIPSVFPDAVFARNELAKLQEFCVQNQGFHIISTTGVSLMVNVVDHRALNYSIGKGSSDPSLCYYSNSNIDPRAWKASPHLKALYTKH